MKEMHVQITYKANPDPIGAQRPEANEGDAQASIGQHRKQQMRAQRPEANEGDALSELSDEELAKMCSTPGGE